MIVFHGSHVKGLKTLTYTEENSRFGGDQGLLHGAAIYMTVSEEEAKAYATGGSYYKIQINGSVFDATDKEVLINFIKEFCQKYDIDEDLLLNNELIQSTINDTLSGKSSGIVFARNIGLIISNHESLYYSIIVDLFSEDANACDEAIQGLFQYSFVRLNNFSSDTWVLGLDKDGAGIEILEEIHID